MSRQPLLLWRKAAAIRTPNAIEDLDEFDRNMSYVMLNCTVRATGIVLKYNRYSCNTMGDIASDFERGNRVPTNDITEKKRPRNRNPNRIVGYDGKIKYDPDNMGCAYLWVPFSPPRWEKLTCTNPDMEGMPLWLHLKAMELANKEADEFCSRELQSELRATLFDAIANVNKNATAKKRRLLGRALTDKRVSAALARHVEVHPEPITTHQSDDLFGLEVPEPNYVFEDNNFAGSNRKDTLESTPRPKQKVSKRPKTWAQQQQDKQRSSRRKAGTDASKSTTVNTGEKAKRRSSGIGLKWKEAS